MSLKGATIEEGNFRRKAASAKTLSAEEEAAEALDTEFLGAIAASDLDKVKKMIGDNQNVNVGDDSGASSIHYAVKLDTDAIFRLLVEKGAFVDYMDDYGKRPITIAMEMGTEHTEATGMVGTLLSMKDGSGNALVDLAGVNPKNGNTLLHQAAWVGNEKAMELLLKACATAMPAEEFKGDPKSFIEKTNKQGQTVLHVAAFRAPKTVATMLTEAGANHKAVEKNGRRLSKETPMEMATAMGREDTAEYLKSLDVTLNAVTFASRMKMQKSGAS